MVKDFENDRQEASSGWWDWRPSKVALERLFLDGSLMTTRTRDFQKLYDVPKNLIPGRHRYGDADARRICQTHDPSRIAIPGYRLCKRNGWRARFVKGHVIREEIRKLVDEGEVCTVKIEGLPTTAPLYMLPAYSRRKIERSDDAYILSPFDTLNVFRHRLRDFFDFDYQIECFVPEPKRKYGYFSLPILIGDTFVARMDSKADRKQKTLIIHNLHFEPVKRTKPDFPKFITALHRFARFNNCTDIVFKKSNNKPYLKAIKDAL